MGLITIERFKKEQGASAELRKKAAYRPMWEVHKFLDSAYNRLAPERQKITDIMVRAQGMLAEAMSLPYSAARSQQIRDSFGLVDEGRFMEHRLVLPHMTGVEVVPGNLLLNEGIAVLQTLLIGTGGTAFSNANAYLGVGDDNTAASAGQTGLQAATNKLYKAMEAGYPSVSSQTTTWRSVFGSAEANFAWAEFTVANGNSDASDNLNRKVSAEGTKSSGQTWTLDLSILWS